MLSVPPCTSASASVCQLHTAIGKSGALRVSFVGRESFTSAAVVQWGYSQALPLEFSVNATTMSYSLQDLCAPDENRLRGWEEPGLLHHAELPRGRSPLPLYYRVGFPQADVWSDVTGPVQSPSAATPRLAMFGDMGTYNYAPHNGVLDAKILGAVDDKVALSLAKVATSTPGINAVVHVGDLAYAHDGPASRWRYWFDEIEATASITPWMINCGNHDCLWGPSAINPHGPTWPGAMIDAGGDGGQCGVPTDARFWMPGDPAELARAGWTESRNASRNNIFYSFDVGPVHVAMISSEHDLSASSIQIAWLERDLASLNRSATPFVILGIHRPIYTSTQGGFRIPETLGMQATLEPLLLRHRVQMVAAGHYHQYERSCRIAKSKCVSSLSVNATVHVTVGIGGLQHHSDWVSPVPSWVEKQDASSYGYLLLDVVNATHAHAKAVNAVANDEVFDEFWLLA